MTLFVAILLTIVSCKFITGHIIKNWKKYKTISHMYSLPKFRRSFYIGLILTGILQIAFALSISFPPLFQEIYLGKLLFIIGGSGCILLGLFSQEENFIIHTIAASLYFFAHASAAILITLQVNLPWYFQFTSLGIVVLWVCIITFQLFRKNGRYAVEASHILLSYVWIILIGLAEIVVKLNF